VTLAATLVPTPEISIRDKNAKSGIVYFGANTPAVHEALDLLVEADRLAPGRSEILHRMALLFDERGNPKRALELAEAALAARPEDVALHAARVQFLLRLDRRDAAKQALDAALELDGAARELQQLRRRLLD